MLAAAALAAAAFVRPPVEYDNARSRYLLVGAMVDEGTMAIDRFESRTQDKARSGGRVYSNKAIGAPLLAAPFYWVLRRTILRPLDLLPEPTLLDDPWALWAVRLFAASLPFAAAAWLLFTTAVRMGAPPAGAMAASWAYSFGSIALLHAGQFSGHQAAAFFALAAFALLLPGEDGRGQAALRGLAAGLCAGFAALSDYPAGWIAILLGVTIISRRHRAQIVGGYVSGLAVCGAILGVYNQVCFGSPWVLSYSRQLTPAFREGSARGFMGVASPDLGALIGLLASPSRGLFFIMPVMLLSILGLRRLSRLAGRRREAAILAALPAGYALLIGGPPGGSGWRPSACASSRALRPR